MSTTFNHVSTPMLTHTPRSELLQLVGVHEVAEMLGITKGALGARRRRRSFPAPLAELRCGPIWGRWQIEKYLAERDRSRERRWHIDRIDELRNRKDA